MSLAIAERAATLPDTAAIGDDADILTAILSPWVNLAIWERPVPAAVDAAILSRDLAALREIRISAAPEDARDALTRAAREILADGILAPLAADAGALALIFADIMRLARIELRLERIVTNACYKFHSDYVPVRLITTYRGPGTDWLTQQAAATLAAGASPDSMRPRRLDRGHVGLFKGRMATDDPIVHRSPPIAGSGIDRLVLVINPAPDADLVRLG